MGNTENHNLTAYHERPTLTVNGVFHSKSVWTPIKVKAGDEIDLECEGVVGKPPVPMVWEIMDMLKDGSYRQLTDKDGAIGEGNCFFVTIQYIYNDPLHIIYRS